jgi:hypothetical protein
MAIDVYDDLPPSPTLTNPDMILPSRPGDSILTMSAPSAAARAASSSQQYHNHHHQPQRRVQHPGILQRFQDPNDPRHAFADFSSYGAPISPAKTSPSILVRPSSPLESIEESDTTPTRRVYGGASNALASSPTLRMLGDHGPNWPLMDGRPRSGMSNASSSEHSDDLERWAANKAALADEGSVATLEEDDEQFGQYGADENERYANRRNDPEDDFLSRRAEIILANAKSRLKVSNLH